MIEMLFQLGFALACSITTMAVAFWALTILPNWLGKRQAAKKAAKAAKAAEADT